MASWTPGFLFMRETFCLLICLVYSLILLSDLTYQVTFCLFFVWLFVFLSAVCDDASFASSLCIYALQRLPPLLSPP